MSTKRIQILGGLPQANWAQTDETKNDYIKNKPTLGVVAEQDIITKDFLSDDVQESLVKADAVEQIYETKSDSIAKLNVAKEYSDTNLGIAKSYSDKVVSNAMYTLEPIIDGKADLTHDHNSNYYTKIETDNIAAQKSQVQIITWEADD